VLAMGRNLKDLRRELRDTCEERDKLRDECLASIFINFFNSTRGNQTHVQKFLKHSSAVEEDTVGGERERERELIRNYGPSRGV